MIDNNAKLTSEGIIKAPFESSFTYHHTEQGRNSNLPIWHFNSHFQLVFISNGQGKRLIGGHESYFEDGDLVMVGPNLPKMSYLQKVNSQFTEIVIQAKKDFLGNEIYNKPEFMAIERLFERAESGLVFGDHTKWVVAKRLYEMKVFDNFSKLLTFLMILQILAYAEDVRTLNIKHLSVNIKPQDHQRMQSIHTYVEENFKDPISNDQIARYVNMTTPAFCRYFKRQTQKTFTQFVTEYRVGHARRLLAQEDMTISLASLESGFNNLSHFNKKFKQIVGVTPSEFRKNMKKLVSIPVFRSESFSV